ncbi:hypothetical protein BJY00DRAFT_320101 [Aspergillus carlsbadensis]|nr:hypothetical protein BJY00DRAFT_320101 [Aspergillus carlsbadensis]
MSSDGQQHGSSVILLYIASYNVVETLVWIICTFQRSHGLYFYSVLITDISLMGFIGLSFLGLYTRGSVVWSVSLWGIVCSILQTAQILILYARLHLLCPHNPHVVRTVRILIIVTSIILTPLLIVPDIYATVTPSWLVTCGLITRSVQVAVTVREMAACAVYCLQALRELSAIAAHKGRVGEKVIHQLIAVQVTISLMDAALIGLVFVSPPAIQWGYTSLANAIKLKMEFAILNTLKTLLQSPTEFLPSSRVTEPQP